MRRFFSAFVLFALLYAQAGPGVCAAAGGHVGGVHEAAPAQGSAGMHVHAHDAVEMHGGAHVDNTAHQHGAAHQHGVAHHHGEAHQLAAGHQHGAAAATLAAAPEAPSAPVHDGSCGDLLRCHWAAVPAAEQASLSERAARVDLQMRGRDALATDAAALLTPPPRNPS